MIHLIELCDSDGNDCTVYDLLIEAETKDAAVDAAWTYVDETWPDDEHDGGEGTFHPCDCVCDHRKKSVCDRCSDKWECSHGGILLDTYNVETYPTWDEARRAAPNYHRTVELAGVKE